MTGEGVFQDAILHLTVGNLLVQGRRVADYGGLVVAPIPAPFAFDSAADFFYKTRT